MRCNGECAAEADNGPGGTPPAFGVNQGRITETAAVGSGLPIGDLQVHCAAVHAERRERTRIPEDPLHRRPRGFESLTEVPPLVGVDVEQVCRAHGDLQTTVYLI